MSYVISLDQGTTSSRAVLFDEKCRIKAIAQQEFRQIFPRPGWVEHDPNEILNTQTAVLGKVIQDHGVRLSAIHAIGITNQRETTVVWDRNSGQPVYNAIVWQDKRTAAICEDLKRRGLESYVRENTGLVIDSYFSATKIKWILDNIQGVRQRADKGELAFGTVDSWLIWNLTGGTSHVTDYTNASRTMLYNIRSLQWDKKLLGELGIPESMLPSVLPSAADFGHWKTGQDNVPIAGVAGDQHAALFGQACFEPGMVKNTYGTGCFMLMNTGSEIQLSRNGLVTT
ncbi:MAG TPA: FGGY family carbohydrate kinase, partial [Cyclobacteriaceae bacterium]